ncbi:MAG: hypothetical protein ACK5AZ_05950 [Bryobacteraceae bacterium]
MRCLLLFTLLAWSALAEPEIGKPALPLTVIFSWTLRREWI